MSGRYKDRGQLVSEPPRRDFFLHFQKIKIISFCSNLSFLKAKQAINEGNLNPIYKSSTSN
jgi:hypothetical protein